MRKETTTRLLLSLFTAFVMVAGALGAALPAMISEESVVLDEAESEFVLQASETGDAPVSADTDRNTVRNRNQQPLGQSLAFETEEMNSNGPTSFTERMEKTELEESPDPEGRNEHGTRNPDTVDALGPYGTIPDPEYEGNPITFTAAIEPEEEQDNYQFRWDADGDGEFDGPGPAVDEFFGAHGENEFTMMFNDDAAGEALVQAWDGSWTTITKEGRLLDGYEDDYGDFYYSTTWTAGYTFEVTENVKVTQLGCYRNLYGDPQSTIYNMRLWDDTPSIMAQVNYPSPSTGAWRWYDITPVDLYPGVNYMISYYIYYYRTASTNNMPAQSADGVVVPVAPYYQNGNVYPTWNAPNEWPMLDINYEYQAPIPNVLEDTAELFVLNRVPVVSNPVVSPTTTSEGSADAEFTAEMIDLGKDDTWEYQWDFGDGTESDWLPVPKWSGGMKLLFLQATDYPTYGYDWTADFLNPFLAYMGEGVVEWDQWHWGFPPGQDAAPPLDLLMQYDVVLLQGMGVGGLAHEDVGDVLADYSDAGGAVVQMSNTFQILDNEGVSGRWKYEDYTSMTYADVVSGYNDLGAYDASHPIMAGVSDFGQTLWTHDSYTVTPWAYWVASYNTGQIAVAATDEGHHGIPGSGRIAAINSYVYSWYEHGADYFRLIANALWWASQADPVETLDMPIPLPPISHVYADDHPTHVTPSDEVQPSVRVRDDDHGRLIPLAGTYIDEKFEGDFPPAGWTVINNNPGEEIWRRNDYYGRTNYAGGDGFCADADSDAAYPDYYMDTELWTPVMDLSNVPAAKLPPIFSFVTALNILSSFYEYSDVDISVDGGASWSNIYHWTADIDAYGPGATFNIDLTPYLGYSDVVIRFHYYTPGWYWWWEIDDVYIDTAETFTVEGMSDFMDTPMLVTVMNVFPEAVNTMNIVLEQDENTPISFEGFNIVDPAFGTPNEEFFYRWDFDDGTGTDWAPGGVVKGSLNSVIYLHSYWAGGGYNPDALMDRIRAELGPSVVVDAWEIIDFAGNVPNVPTLADIEDYDVAIFDIELNWLSAVGTQLCNDMGDLLADYADTPSPSGRSHGVVQMNSFAPDQWGLHGRWEDDGYNAIENSAGIEEVGGPSRDMGTVYEPTHPIMNGVSAVTTLHRSPCDSERAGATLLADYDNGYKFAACFDSHDATPENPSPGKTVALNLQPHDGMSGDGDLLIANAIRWVAVGASPELDPIPHNFMDNGKYDVYLQIIDDDMYWDFSSGYPVFVGPNGEPNDPGADPMDWIGGTHFLTEIANTDPVISPRIKAFVQLDLRLRISGTKDCDATMTLYETLGDETTVLGTASVTRDPGSPDIGIMPSVELLLNKENTYELVVQVTGGSGGNPTWIFDMVFPDGKYKELKHTFNEEHGWTWVISNSELKAALLGHDIIFQADADDKGSDDLAFVWNFGDSTPHGIHLFANVDQTTPVDAVSDEATVIFDQLGLGEDGRDTAFDKPLNTVRTPDGTPIHAADTISHVFDANQPYYYYVTLVVMDDDVGDEYPSTQLHPMPGCDMAFLEIDFR